MEPHTYFFQPEGRGKKSLPSAASHQNIARPLPKAPVASGRLLLGPALDGCWEKTKRWEIQSQPLVAKVSYHWVEPWWPWDKGQDKKEDRHPAVSGSGRSWLESQVHVRWPVWLCHLQLWNSTRQLGLYGSLPPILAQPECVSWMVGLTSFTCFFYIHGTTSFRGLPVPPGGRRLPLQELVFFRPLTLALAPLVLQGLLPRHNQNPLVKGTVLRRDPCPGMVCVLVPGPGSVFMEVWIRSTAQESGKPD